MTILEKRLIALSALGIRVEHESGHRFILSVETDCFNFQRVMDEVNIHVCKIYGGINEALNAVDTVLLNTCYISLENHCNTLIDLYDYDKTNIEERFINCISFYCTS